MKKSFPFVLLLAGAVTLGACSREADNKPVASATPSGESTAPPAAAANEREHALVRVVDAVPGKTQGSSRLRAIVIEDRLMTEATVEN